jgi:catechol 2,3-dioxygenase-like lactoylglutathione lyase family enzyme
MLALASCDHVTLVVDDLLRARAWYAAVLGFHAGARPAALESLAVGEWLEHAAIAI